MPTEAKAIKIDELSETFKSANVALMVNFKGLTVEDISSLRTDLRKSGSRIQVVKNTLAKLAAEKSGMEGAKEWFKGPVAVTMGFDDDIAAPAKAIVEFAKKNEGKISVLGGVVEGSVIDASGVKELAEMPPKPVVQSMLLGVLQAPARDFVSLMANVPRSFMNVLNNYAEKNKE